MFFLAFFFVDINFVLFFSDRIRTKLNNNILKMIRNELM